MVVNMKLIVIFGLVSFIQCFLEPSCNRDVAWEIYNCAGYTDLGSVLTLDASSTSKGAPCFAVPKNQIEKPAKLYIMRMRFKNIQAWRGIDSGHIGLIFNMRDLNNYDFVYARLHSPTVQTGYVKNGIKKFGKNLSLLGNRSGSISHSLQIDVLENKTVTVYYDHTKVGTFNATLPTLAGGGVLTWNNYQNIIQFGNFQLIA
ncbi:uncharacterized skeletal organic matrix protein 7-like [Clytia hemisphaerica]